MSKRLDDDERLATAGIHLIEALNSNGNSAAAREHLELAEKQYRIILNRGKDRWDADYLKPPQPVIPPHGGQGADE